MRLWRRREPDLDDVLRRLRDRIAPELAENVTELVGEGEDALAIEALADTLYEDRVALEFREERDLERLATEARAEPARWMPLRELVAPRPSPERIVETEFGTYYLGEEYNERMGERAEYTAGNWVGWYSPNEARAAAALLRELAADAKHPLHEGVEAASNFDWREGDVWPVFQRLALAIADRVEELAPE